jgi:hypothetical protein
LRGSFKFLFLIGDVPGVFGGIWVRDCVAGDLVRVVLGGDAAGVFVGGAFGVVAELTAVALDFGDGFEVADLGLELVDSFFEHGSLLACESLPCYV